MNEYIMKDEHKSILKMVFYFFVMVIIISDAALYGVGRNTENQRIYQKCIVSSGELPYNDADKLCKGIVSHDPR